LVLIWCDVNCFEQGSTAVFRSITTDCHWAHGVVVSHPLRMQKALGSNPSVSILETSMISLQIANGSLCDWK
jgi:hypothetical protein